jgi:hypothetical protein
MSRPTRDAICLTPKSLINKGLLAMDQARRCHFSPSGKKKPEICLPLGVPICARQAQRDRKGGFDYFQCGLEEKDLFDSIPFGDHSLA